MIQRRIDDIFGEALDLSGEERERYLAEACNGDTQGRSEVESLLAAHGDAGAFMNGATLEPADLREPGALSEGPGTVIGRYRLVQQIGEGGFGVVFLAEQREPLARRVALKIIKPGMDTKQVIARFEAERQALALMDHPNIARVLDAGSTDSGRPYFVMQLVCGDPITTYCDREQLPLRERLDLFRQICHAVQHAHQKGIIHRDLKPSNILVADLDGRATPKIIDFGIAKATGGRLTHRTLFTEFRQFMGTPEYTSPEQALSGGVDIDTRSDIYSLGVVLYELLTGTTPFESESLRSAGFAEVQRIIREEEPPRPSVRLSTLGSRAVRGSRVSPGSAPSPDVVDFARRRGAAPHHLGSLVRGDLDWVVMKCLEKNRSRRYETANALALDIGRHLAGEPVVAAPPSRLYRLRKLVARNRGTAAAALAITLVLLLGVLGTSTGLMRAVAAEAKAQQRADRLADMVAFLESQLADMDVVLLYTGSDEARRCALPNLRAAMEERERVLGPGNRSTLSAMTLLGAGLLRQGDSPEAERSLRRALADSRGVLADDDPLVINMLSLHGWALHRLGRLDEAEKLGAQAVRGARIRFSGQVSMAGSLWSVLMRYGNTLRDLGRFEEAEAVLLEAYNSRAEHARGTHLAPGSPTRYLAELYDAWHAAEPDAGYDAKAAEWRALRQELRVGGERASSRGDGG